MYQKTNSKTVELLNKIFFALSPVLLILILVIIWQANCVIKDIPEWKLPKPSSVIVAFFTNFKETLPLLGSTYFNIITGYLLAVLIGLVLALILSNSKVLSMALTPIIVILCCVPMVTLVPLLLVTMGTGPGPKILTIIIQCFPIVNMNACVGFANVDPTRIELMKSMKATKFQLYRYCMFRDAMPNILNGIKLSSVLAMIAGVSAELCGGSGGLGNEMKKLISISKTAEAFSYLIYVIILGMLLYGLISLIEKFVTKGMKK